MLGKQSTLCMLWLINCFVYIGLLLYYIVFSQTITQMKTLFFEKLI